MSAVAVAPDRSYEQRMEALRVANRVRSARAEMKVAVKARRVCALEVLEGLSADFASMKVWELLMAIPKIGRVKANKMLAQAKVSPSKTIGGLTERQRRELVRVVRACAPRGSVRR